VSTPSGFKPRFLTASEYVLDLFGPTENVAVVVRNRATGRTIQRIARADTVAGSEFQAWLASQNGAGSDVFLGMNPIKDDARSRIKANIKDIRTLYLDLDRNGDQSLQAIRNSPEVPPPNFVLDTSPGKHQVVWKITGVSRDQAESLLRALASEFDGDPAATDSTRVLRLPGFANRKLTEEFVVRAHHETDAVHMLGDFTIEADSPQAVRHVGDAHQSRTIAPGHKSQSERDWAYAKRCLARGVPPQEVIRNIADFRAEDKYDPQDYARRTVDKAQAELNARNPPSNFMSDSSAESEREP
jgi:RepB DNA-primase from phage plasmid